MKGSTSFPYDRAATRGPGVQLGGALREERQRPHRGIARWRLELIGEQSRQHRADGIDRTRRERPGAGDQLVELAYERVDGRRGGRQCHGPRQVLAAFAM